MRRHSYAVGLTASLLLVASVAEASAFGIDWRVPEPRLQPSASSERASRRPVSVTVTPTAGDPQTTFLVRFASRARLGPYDGRHRTYEIVMQSPQTVACIGRIDRWADRARRGTVLTIRVPPHAKGGQWCQSRYRGSVHYVDTQLCPALGTCETPDALTRVRRLVGRFSVHVR